jgi:hypothetical protein
MLVDKDYREPRSCHSRRRRRGRDPSAYDNRVCRVTLVGSDHAVQV